MARAGVELFQIQLFARWESSVILRYVKEAPLASSHLLAARLTTTPEMPERKVLNSDLTELVADNVDRDALLNVIQENLGGEVAAEPLSVDKKAIEDAAAEVLNAKPAEDLPTLVLNDSLKNRLRVHRPRDGRFALCGWPWADMVASGVGVVLKPAEGEYYSQCGTCLRRARLRGLVGV